MWILARSHNHQQKNLQKNIQKLEILAKIFFFKSWLFFKISILSNIKITKIYPTLGFCELLPNKLKLMNSFMFTYTNRVMAVKLSLLI